MDLQWLSLRILHITFGTFWVGTDVFVTFLLIPRLRTLGPSVEHAVMGALMRYLPPVMTISAILTAVTGIWMAVTLQGWNPAWMLATGWGVAMLVGLVGTVAALVVGLGVLPSATIRYDRLSRAVQGRPPSTDEAQQLRQIGARVTLLATVNSVLLIIVVIAMAVARYA